MKVILLTDVARVGRKYDIKEVPQGYAQNFLLKKGLAKVATPDAVKEVEKKKESIYLSRSIEKENLKKNLLALKEVQVEIKAVANEQGHLFKGIHAKDIVEALKKNANVAIDEDMIDLPEAIKTVGFHTIHVLWEGEKGTFHLEVVRK